MIARILFFLLSVSIPWIAVSAEIKNYEYSGRVTDRFTELNSLVNIGENLKVSYIVDEGSSFEFTTLMASFEGGAVWSQGENFTNTINVDVNGDIQLIGGNNVTGPLISGNSVSVMEVNLISPKDPASGNGSMILYYFDDGNNYRSARVDFTLMHKSQLSIQGGFLKLDVTNGKVPADNECNEVMHRGRMVYDDINDLVYYCGVNGWSAK